MERNETNSAISEEVILKEIVVILEDMTYDWDMDFAEPIGSNSKLVADLEFESVDVVQFIVAIEERFQRRELPYEELLMIDGRYVDEIRVGDVVAFLHRHFNHS